MLAFGYFIQFQLRYLLCLCKGNVIQTTIYRLHLLYNNFKFVSGFPCRKTVETKQVQSPWEVSDCSTIIINDLKATKNMLPLVQKFK